jgi:hypothetical protein
MQYGRRRIFNRSFYLDGIRKVLKQKAIRYGTSDNKVLDVRFKGSQARS